ncbi:hypothetical protein [Salisediminibacterium selenitireducens]|uniref:Uncharacterized protein n=1 Tax=Bacillus selenitireducens (strain ATCC 700615 / DSM 15326 / MLS10) TaxID=439292 RepID=D6XUL7_BACIE|nr:hypothetical protein [Salisediminibacterium selenitireducens]ADH99503.1 hypothetical protein Bsel_1999 [[Bacillus] selenitireducens MLS10]
MRQVNAVVEQLTDNYAVLHAKSLSKEWTIDCAYIPIAIQKGSWLQLTLSGLEIVMIEMDQEDILASRLKVERKWKDLQRKKSGNS